MKSLLKILLKRLSAKSYLRFQAFNRLIRNENSYLYTTGWMNSLELGVPLDADGNPVPWMNYPTIGLLSASLTGDLDLFEFGSGYSTLFFARKVKSVTSVEYDKNWFRVIKEKLPQNAEIIFKEKDVDGAYCRSVRQAGIKYDVVIVDGRDRVNCVKQSMLALAPQGVIVLDDAQREWYQEGIRLAKKNGFRCLLLEGLKATGSCVDKSAILYRDGNCLGL